MVINSALDHNRQKVPANTIIFNIHQVRQRAGLRLRSRRGIEGVDHSGTNHRFLEGEDPLYFSTKLFDVKCIPMRFKSVLQLPQTARVYLQLNTEEDERKLLHNLSTVTITDVIDGHHLVARKLSEGGHELGPIFTIPLNAGLTVWSYTVHDIIITVACVTMHGKAFLLLLQVVAIQLEESDLLDEISHRRCISMAKSCPNLLCDMVSKNILQMLIMFTGVGPALTATTC